MNKTNNENVLTKKDKEFLIARALSCEICKGFLLECMYQPLRCPGLSYNENGDAITSTGKLWKDIEAEHEKKHEEQAKLYINEHKDHLISHGMYNKGLDGYFEKSSQSSKD